MRRIKWQHQENDFGCGFACLAMLTGKPYTTVRSELLDSYEVGLDDDSILNYLYEHGFFVSQRKGISQPFAKAHICKVLVSFESLICHVVVMLEDGTVLDPASQQPKKLTDYLRVLWVAGIYKPQARSKRNEKVRLSESRGL